VSAAELSPGASFAGYRIVRVLGRGGFGVVYEAVDSSGRAVALKLMSGHGLRDASLRRRFEREGRAAAAIVHENVARCFGSGVSGNVPFIAFELLPGGSLRDRLKGSGRLSPHEAAAIGAQVARGLAAIHAAGLVHRDLKPANVLFDGQGTAKVSDLGLVRRTDGAQSVDLTKTGETLGTVAYMAPEQIDHAKSVDARADLYSLGCLLCALLTGEAPFQGSAVAVMKHHLMDAPPKPSASAPGVPPELDALVLRLLEKEPDARPQSAGDVARALDAIASKGTGTRSRLTLAAVAIAAGALLCGGAAVFFARRHAPEPAPAPEPPWPAVASPASATPLRAEASPTPEPSEFPEICKGFLSTKRTRLVSLFGGYAWKVGGTYECGAVSPDGKQALIGGNRIELVEFASGLVRVLDSRLDFTRAVAYLPDGRRAVAAGDDGTIRVFDVSSARELVSIKAHERKILALAVMPDGDHVLSGSDDGTIGVSSLTARSRVNSIPCEIGAVLGISLSGDGRLVLAGGERGAELHNVASGDLVRRLEGVQGWTRAVAITPDGTRALAGGPDVPGGMNWMLWIWSLSDGTHMKHPPLVAYKTPITSVAVSPDGKLAVTTAEDGFVKLWDLVKLVQLWDLEEPRPDLSGPRWDAGHFDMAEAAVFTGDGTRIFSVALHGCPGLLFVDSAEAPVLRAFEGHGSWIGSIAVSPDGKRVLTGGADRDVRLWDVGTGKASSVRFTAEKVMPRVAFLSDGRAVASLGHELRIFGAGSASEGETLRAEGYVSDFALHESDKRLIAGDLDGALWEFDLAKTESKAQLLPVQQLGPLYALAAGRDAILSSGKDRTVKLTKLTDISFTIEPETVKTYDGPVRAIACDAERRHAVWSSDDGTVALWHFASKELRTVKGTFHSKDLPTVATISPKGDLVVSSSEDGTLRLWSFTTGEELDRIDLGTSADYASALAFAPDGRSFYAGTAKGVVLKFELTD
jgi:WD40 repeat protein/tRNA A-37 threonylcarbamoyl transferase component Bud32